MAPASINEQALENPCAVNYGEEVCVESCTLEMGDSTHKELLLWPFCLQRILFLISLLFQIFQSSAANGRREAMLRYIPEDYEFLNQSCTSAWLRAMAVKLWVGKVMLNWMNFFWEKQRFKVSPDRMQLTKSRVWPCQSWRLPPLLWEHIYHPVQHCLTIQNSTVGADWRHSSRTGSREGDPLLPGRLQLIKCCWKALFWEGLLW